MSVCVVNGGHCVCQPDEGIPCIPLQTLKAEKESLRQRVKELEAEIKDWDSVAHDLSIKASNLEAELAAIKSNRKPVAWYDPSNTNSAQSVTFSQIEHERWPHLYPIPLYVAPTARGA